eukprot:XP_015582191.1 uncharacterized protein LOC107262222 [Ricinus communis]
MAEKGSLLTIPCFDGDYEHWAMLMENLLRSKKWWHLVDLDFNKPASGVVINESQREVLADLKLKDLKISRDEKVKDAQLQTLRREFEVLEMKMGIEGPEISFVESTSKFTLGSRTKVSKHSINVGEEQALRATVDVSRERSGERGRGRGTYRGRGRGRQSYNCATIECFKCHKLGHYKFECPSWDKEANYVEFNEEEEMLLMAYVELYQAKREDAWFLDSGCSNHMCGDKGKFSELNEEFSRMVKLGNNNRISVLGKGKVKLCIEGVTHIVHELYAPSKVCDDCMKGKQHRDPIPKKSTWRASHKLQLVHIDICGPISPASNNDKRYMLCFIDDFSRKSWTYFLLEKSEAYMYFRCFKMLVEKESGMSIKYLRTDRGGELCSTKFSEFCKLNIIKRQLTTAYTPQQNEVVERKNRTVLNLVRSTLSEKKVPKPFWPEAVKWVIYVLNRSPTAALSDMTPEEAWSEKKASVVHFRIFECVGHVHIPDATRKKLEDKSVKMCASRIQ